jgi:hypothetical protein
MRMRTLTTLVALAGATLTPLAARAAGVDEASPTGKGIVGGALLGAELVMVTQAAFKVKPAWAYVVGGVAGGAAGGVGGYFVEDQGDARAPMLMLAGGLAFAIPTVVAVLSATAYEPPANFVQDQPPADEPLAEPPAPSGAAPAPAAAAPADASPARTTKRYLPSAPRRLSLKLPPPALVGFQGDRLALGVPNVAVFHAYSRTERLMFNAPNVAEIRIPVLDVAF